jgi:hypothetical protein
LGEIVAVTDRPRLVCYAHTWGLLELPKLPHDRSWTFEEAIDRVIAAGYNGVQGEPERGREILERGLRFAAGGRANTAIEANELVSRCAGEGAECVTVHLGWGHESDEEQDKLVGALLAAAERAGLPAYVETHRATIVQDLYRTTRLIRRFPQIRFNGDFSHYYCSNEAPYRGYEAFRAQLMPVLERVRFFHGRVSNGQQIQVSIHARANQAHVDNFVDMWQLAMRHWLQNAQPGEVLPFVPELGPPSSGYAIVDDDGSTERELSDRWQESLDLRELAFRAFAAAAE